MDWFLKDDDLLNAVDGASSSDLHKRPEVAQLPFRVGSGSDLLT